jgi:RNA polymerase sigma-70 factor (ECF subfamily)
MTDSREARRSVAAGGQDEFEQLTNPYRRELTVHCYRILGSFEDAEDALQEALLRAWRQLDSLKSQAALRAWLYKIATHVALNMLAARKVRSMPPARHAAADPNAPLPAPSLDPIWLDPLPDEYLEGFSPGPEARIEIKQSVSLAFLTVLQQLPGRQRAVLILRDVLGWKAQEVAELLDASVPAVNSALQRARATLRRQPAQAGYALTSGPGEQTAALLAEFVQAWEMGDARRLTALLREDAIFTMPPLPAWFRGRAAIQEFLDRHVFSAGQAGHQFRVIATRANGCPAFASYQLEEAGTYRPGALILLTITGAWIAQIDDFLPVDQRLFSRFNLPLLLG